MLEYALSSPLRRLLLILSVILLLSLFFSVPTFAAEYGCGTYGADTFGTGEDCVVGAGGGLVNTGQALAIGIPALMILAGVGLLYKTRRKKSKQPNDPTQPSV